MILMSFLMLRKKDYLIYIGRITGRKGVQTASDVAKATGHQLYIVGQGELNSPSEGLNLANEEHIHYMPAVGPEKRAELLAVLMPTYYIEPFGSVAMRLNCVVLQ
jgi:glycosyltransferase involved in cell wall biosynthesis